ncbi:uncharacterized protein UTRI_03095_B [Ustilago trichophora]|uniref:Uncharacterized protein n=1 Tax=Ustilago trichophora TaxID=86804 RepID=A0A5C3E460_9BASI|nr:uncharacterized protein UTRI_03095_B [Ustilago trichophora]
MDDVDQQYELHPPTVDTSTATTTIQNDPSSTKTPKTAAASAGPIPMTMPSILRNSGISQSNHLSYLLDRSRGSSSSSSYPPTSSRAGKSRSGSNANQLGRRKQRRSENARLLSNPHAVRPSIKDYRLHSNEIKSTFHSSSSSSSGSKPYNQPVPAHSNATYSEPTHDPVSATQGHFGKSLRDAQRVLKRLEVGNISDAMIAEDKAGELERFIWLVDREIRLWSTDDVHVFPSTSGGDRKLGRVLLDSEFNFTAPPLDSSTTQTELPTVELDMVKPGQEGGQLVEFQRTPNALVWLIHDPFLRLVVHCLARVCKCPSFSKDDVARPGLRFTWVLNRNPLARRGRRGRRVSVSSLTAAETALNAAELGRPVAVQMVAAGGMLDTPPTTDFDSQTETETESELGGDTDTTDGESLAGSVVVVQPIRSTTHRDDGDDEGEGDADPEENAEGDEGLEAVDTDEEEAEILRRVRRWAIDSHRQRAAEDEDDTSATSRPSRAGKTATRSRLSKVSSTKIQSQDPDATLTASVIAEEEDDDEDDADEVEARSVASDAA